MANTLKWHLLMHKYWHSVQAVSKN